MPHAHQKAGKDDEAARFSSRQNTIIVFPPLDSRGFSVVVSTSTRYTCQEEGKRPTFRQEGFATRGGSLGCCTLFVATQNRPLDPLKVGAEHVGIDSEDAGKQALGRRESLCKVLSGWRAYVRTAS